LGDEEEGCADEEIEGFLELMLGSKLTPAGIGSVSLRNLGVSGRDGGAMESSIQSITGEIWLFRGLYIWAACLLTLVCRGKRSGRPLM
jgi:hypothetical protein